MCVTFVTAYLKVYNEDYDDSRTFENRLKHFISILKLGINVCIFIEPELKYRLCELEKEYINLTIIECITIEQLELYKLRNNYSESISLPSNRNTLKDTEKYMYLMLSKIEFLKKSIDINPYKSKYFCWFDFSLPYIFKDMNNTLLKIKNISNIQFKDQFIYMPGCWNFKMNNIEYLKNNIVWRFCGGFFIGDKDSLNHFYITSHDYFLRFLYQTKTLVWEVNYWAWLESNGLFNPIWYLADHNDSIIDIPVI